MKSALLRGIEHTAIGAVELVAEAGAAIAISRGGAPKTYAYTDPNEDAALLVHAPGGTLVAVADGHWGARGAEEALEHLLRECAADWTSEARAEKSGEAWRDCAQSTNDALLDAAERRRFQPSPTTLALALVRPAEDLLLHASTGDSHVFLSRTRSGDRSPAVEEAGSASLGRDRCHFLGHARAARDQLRDRSRVACEPLSAVRAVALATDGLSETGIGGADPSGCVQRALERSAALELDRGPEAACREIIDSALGAQRKNRSGDNVACAVLMLDD